MLTRCCSYALGEHRSYCGQYQTGSDQLRAGTARGDRTVSAACLPAPDDTTHSNGRSERARQRIEQADVEYRKEAQRLSEMVLGPVAARWSARESSWDRRRAAVSAVRSAAHTGWRGRACPMVVEHEIVNLPSASVLAVLRQETKGRQLPTKRSRVGGPVFRSRTTRGCRVSAHRRTRQGADANRRRQGRCRSGLEHCSQAASYGRLGKRPAIGLDAAGSGRDSGNRRRRSDLAGDRLRRQSSDSHESEPGSLSNRALCHSWRVQQRRHPGSRA